jgi:hypothetical protein
VPILAGAFASLLIAWLRGVTPLALGAVRLRWLPLPLLALAVQQIAFGHPSVGGGAPLLWQALSGALLLAFLLANLRYRTLWLVAAGAALNLLVVGLNGGHMPARPADVRAIGFPRVASGLEREGHYQKTGRLDESTRLPLLADVIRLPLPGPGPDRLLSAGDVLVGAGVFLFIQEALMPLRRRRTIDEWTAPPAERERRGRDPGWGRRPPTSTSPSAARSVSTATSTPSPAKSA